MGESPEVIQMEQDDIPDVISEDAPDPDEFEAGEEVHTMGNKLWDTVAVTHDGEVYCLECANDEYVRLAKEDPYQIPYGGPVERGDEWDCPGPSCGRCHRRIADVSVLHYEGVCHPDYCPEMNDD